MFEAGARTVKGAAVVRLSWLQHAHHFYPRVRRQAGRRVAERPSPEAPRREPKLRVGPFVGLEANKCLSRRHCAVPNGRKRAQPHLGQHIRQRHPRSRATGVPPSFMAPVDCAPRGHPQLRPGLLQLNLIDSRPLLPLSDRGRHVAGRIRDAAVPIQQAAVASVKPFQRIQPKREGRKRPVDASEVIVPLWPGPGKRQNSRQQRQRGVVAGTRRAAWTAAHTRFRTAFRTRLKDARRCVQALRARGCLLRPARVIGHNVRGLGPVAPRYIGCRLRPSARGSILPDDAPFCCERTPGDKRPLP